MTEQSHVLLAGSAQDAALGYVQTRLQTAGQRVCLLSNLAGVSASIPLDVDVSDARIGIDDQVLHLRNVAVILVSSLRSDGSIHPLSDTDAQYAGHETLAAWLALLTMARCPVINRPSSRLPGLLLSNIEVRGLARSLGIPTLPERIHTAGRNRAEDSVTACIDLADHRARFARAGELPARPHMLFPLGPDEPLLACTRIGEEYVVDITRNGGGEPSARIREQARLMSTRLLDRLELSYATCVFVARNGECQFTRVYRETPNLLSEESVQRIATALVDLIGKRLESPRGR